MRLEPTIDELNAVTARLNMETQQAPQYRPDLNKERIATKNESHARAPLTAVTNSAIREGRMFVCTETRRTLIISDDHTCYERGNLLGKGGFASVYLLTTDDKDRSQYAAKIISKKRIAKPEKKDKISREIDIQKKMDHVNVVRFIKCFEDDENVFIVMENCGGLTLSKILKVRITLTEPEVRYYLRQLLAGCEYIHSQGVVHRDLKLSNLFITRSMCLKIGDFGLSAYISNVDDKKESICGTPNYISPEVIQKVGHSFPADIWAIGCIIYALLSSRPPFETDCLKSTYKLISKSKYHEPGTASVNARCLIAKCLRIEPSMRPTLQELKTDPFVIDDPTPITLDISAATTRPEQVSKNKEKGDALGANSVPVVAMQYFINTIDQLEISAQGGKRIADFPSAVGACKLLLKVLTTTVKQIKGWSCRVNPDPKTADDLTWITKWVDYSHKYGFGFQLSNDVYGASFKDGFSIAINGRESHVGLQDPAEGVTIACPTSQIPNEYDRQLQVMRYFVKYMDDTLIKGGDAEDQDMDIVNLSEIFLLRWQRTKDSIIMCLSTGTVQVNWLADHTKMVIGKVGVNYRIMYINKRRQAFVYNLADITRHGATSEVKLRLQYVSIVLDKILNNQQLDDYEELDYDKVKRII